MKFGIVGMGLLIISIVFLKYIANTSKSNRKVSFTTPSSTLQTNGEILQSPNLGSFCFSELKEATSNFSPDAVLGEGSFGFVFKGWIDEDSLKAAVPGTGMAIAVKKLKPNGCQGQQEWLAEIKYLGHLRHSNLVKLIGYCIEDNQRLLVYEYMPYSSLDNHLFRRNSHFPPLSWNLCMKVALGAARGLTFLHYEVDVIYRDFKTSNILLDANYNVKLSDLGLAKDGPIGRRTHVSTRALGTEGYGAPDYIRTGHLTAKSDVYSFGVVLLEMLSGRRAIDRNRPYEEENLAKWARNNIHIRKFSRVLNPAFLGQCSMSNVAKAVELAGQCVSEEPKFRPNMKDVVQVLEELQDSDNSNGCKGTNHSKSSNKSKYGRKKNANEICNRKVVSSAA